MNVDSPFFTVIMPVYNVERYLNEAIDSVINQTFKNWELILVDDASTDNSLNICIQYCNSERRIHLLHKEINEGLGMARNSGLNMAIGQWTFFMDSDDRIENYMFERLSRFLLSEEPDIIIFGLTQEYENLEGNVTKKRKILPDERKDKSIGTWILQLDEKCIFAYAWNKIYKTCFLQLYDLYFETTKMIEDFLFNIKAFSLTDKIISVPESYYRYRRPCHKTLASYYADDFPFLCLRRLKEESNLLVQYNCESQNNLEILFKINIKHMFSALVRVLDNDTMSYNDKYITIKKILNNEQIHNSMVFDTINDFRYRLLRTIMFKRKYHICIFMGYLYIVLIKYKRNI